MVPLPLKYRKLVLVCANQKEGGKECCAMKGGVELHAALKLAMAAHDPSVRVTKTGCMGRCTEGANLVIMPDNRWFGGVTQADIPAILNVVGSAPMQKDTDAEFLAA